MILKNYFFIGLRFLLLFLLSTKAFAQQESDYYQPVVNANYNKNLITDYAVDNDFSTDDSAKLQQAIDEVNSNGGGTITLGPANYTFESIELKSNVHIVIDTLAVLRPLGLGNKNLAMFKFSSLDPTTSSGKLSNVSIKSNDDHGEIITPYDESGGVYTFNDFVNNPPSGNTITTKDYKRRFTIDLTQVTNRRIMVFTLNCIDNFSISDFHVQDKYTIFQSVGMGATQIGGIFPGVLSRRLNGIDSKIDAIISNAKNLTSGDLATIVTSLESIKADVKTEIDNQLSGTSFQIRALKSLEKLVGTFADFLDKYNRALDNDTTNDDDITVSKNFLERAHLAAENNLNSSDPRVVSAEISRQKSRAIVNAGRLDLLIEFNGDHFKKRFKELFVLYVQRSQANTFYLPTNGVVKNANTSNSTYGYGLVQAQSCDNVLFKNLSGDGGVTLRFETGFTVMNNQQIGGVNNVFGQNIYGQNGNAAAMVSPHAMHNGTIVFNNIVANSCEFGIRLEKGFISNKYNRDVDEITVGTSKKVTTNKIFSKFGFTSQIKQKHDRFMPDEFVDVARIPGEIYGDVSGTFYKFDRSIPVIKNSTLDFGESVPGPSISPVLQSIYYNCSSNPAVNNFQTTNVVSEGYEFITSNFLETESALDGCPIALSNNRILKNNSDIKVYPNPVTNGILHIEGDHVSIVALYNSLGNLILYKEKNISTTLKLPSLSSGVYYVKILSAKGYVTKKIMIL